MINYKDIITKLQESDYYENADLHIHTTCSDGKLSPEKLIEKALEAGLKFISITDHNSLKAYHSIPIGQTETLTVISGVEFDCWYKTNFMHILGYGININNKELNEICSTNLVGTRLDVVRIFSKRKAEKVIKIIKDAGGIAVLAHPACCWNLNLKKMIAELKSFGLDGVEIYYPYIRHRGIIKFHTVNKVKKIAQELDMIITGGTDCHKAKLS